MQSGPNGDLSYIFGGYELTLHQPRGNWIFKDVDRNVFIVDRGCNKLLIMTYHLTEEL